MFKLEFPANNKPLAAAIGRALLEYGTGKTVLEVDTVAASKMRSSTVDAPSEPVDTRSLSEVQDAAAVEAVIEAVNGDTLDELSQGEDVLAEEPANVDTGAEVRVDSKGVPFDKDYCANAADPFYKSGKTSGQWKKKKAVEEAEYNDWYALRLREVPAATAEPAVEQPIDTTAVFSGQQAPAATAAPVDAGGFMVWVSEMTTAGHFTQADVTAAYEQAGIGAADIFAGDSAVANIATLHGILSAKVPA
jgi:hypothetical protein